MRLQHIFAAGFLLLACAGRTTANDPAATVDGFASPQEAFQAFTSAMAREDWKGVFNCRAPNSRVRSLWLLSFLVVVDHQEGTVGVGSRLGVDWRVAEDLLFSPAVDYSVTLLKLAGVDSSQVAQWSATGCNSWEAQALDRLGIWERITELSVAVWHDEGARILHRAGVDVRAIEEDGLLHPPDAAHSGIGEAHAEFLAQEAKRQGYGDDDTAFIAHRYFAKVSDSAALYRRVMEWDESGISDEERKAFSAQFAQFSTIKLDRVVIKGNSATGICVDSKTGKPTTGEPLSFHKVGGRWYVELDF